MSPLLVFLDPLYQAIVFLERCFVCILELKGCPQLQGFSSSEYRCFPKRRGKAHGRRRFKTTRTKRLDLLDSNELDAWIPSCKLIVIDDIGQLWLEVSKPATESSHKSQIFLTRAKVLEDYALRSMEPIAGGSVCNDPYTRMELSSLEEGRKEQIWQAKRGQGGSRQIGSHIHPQSDLVEVLLLHPECRQCKIVGLGEQLSILLF